MITLENINLKFNSVTLFDDLNLSFEKEKTHILLGPSGCGKTSILRIITGLLQPQSGNIKIDNIHIDEIPSTFRSQKIGYMFQEDGLFPHMTVEKNILFPTIVHERHRVNYTKFKNRMFELFEMVNLSKDIVDRHPSSLSGGQKQRVALVRSLILDQDIVLMDEPLSALDPLVRLSLQKDLRKIFNELKKTVVLVTHSLTEASFLGDNIYLMNNGSIEQMGPFKTIYENPETKFVKEFVGAQLPQIN